MKKKIIIVLALFFYQTCLAEVIKLKDGKVFQAQIVEETQDYVTVDFLGTPLTYYFENIESIDGKVVHPFEHEIQKYTLPSEENKPKIAQNRKNSLKVDEGLLSEIFKIIESDKAYDALTYYGAGLLCLGFLSYQSVFESYDQGHIVFLYPHLDRKLLEEYRLRLIYNTKRAMRKSVSLNPNECRFILGLALSGLLKLDSYNIQETSRALDKLIGLDKENGLAYYLKALLNLNLNNIQGAWKCIKESQSLSIVIDEYSMYNAILDILKTRSYDEASSVVLASVMVKSIHHYILINITQPVMYLSEEKFESKSMFGKRSGDALEFAQAEMISGMRIASIKPQSFLSEAFGYSVEVSAYEKLITLYKEQKASSKLAQVEQTVDARKVNAEERQFLFQRIVSALKTIPNQTAETNFFITSFKEGEEASARRFLGIE